MKPLGHKAYGSIPHLPDSRMGIGDKRLMSGQVKILTEKTRDKHDVIIVQEKLDGSNVAVAKINDEIIPLTRSGYIANTSNHQQLKEFHLWALRNKERFDDLLKEGERISGEWLLMAHGIKYKLFHEPFVVFDIITKHDRIPYEEFFDRTKDIFVQAHLHHMGEPLSLKEGIKFSKKSHHGGEFAEGVVYRVERKGKVDFMGKWVIPNHECGKYFDDNKEFWNDGAKEFLYN